LWARGSPDSETDEVRVFRGAGLARRGASGHPPPTKGRGFGDCCPRRAPAEEERGGGGGLHRRVLDYPPAGGRCRSYARSYGSQHRTPPPALPSSSRTVVQAPTEPPLAESDSAGCSALALPPDQGSAMGFHVRRACRGVGRARLRAARPLPKSSPYSGWWKARAVGARHGASVRRQRFSLHEPPSTRRAKAMPSVLEAGSGCRPMVVLGSGLDRGPDPDQLLRPLDQGSRGAVGGPWAPSRVSPCA